MKSEIPKIKTRYFQSDLIKLFILDMLNLIISEFKVR